jgi:hypothetical protein
LLYNLQFNRNILDILIVYYVTFSCSVTLVMYIISHAWGKDGVVITTNRGYPLSFVLRYSLTANQVMLATIQLSK